MRTGLGQWQVHWRAAPCSVPFSNRNSPAAVGSVENASCRIAPHRLAASPVLTLFVCEMMGLDRETVFASDFVTSSSTADRMRSGSYGTLRHAAMRWRTSRSSAGCSSDGSIGSRKNGARTVVSVMLVRRLPSCNTRPLRAQRPPRRVPYHLAMDNDVCKTEFASEEEKRSVLADICPY